MKILQNVAKRNAPLQRLILVTSMEMLVTKILILEQKKILEN